MPILILGSRPGPILESRLVRALPLIDAPSLTVVSGRGEAGFMARWLVAHGVPADLVLEEPDATSTNENLENAQALLPDTVVWTVVTSEFHLWRTRLWAWHLGIPIEVVTARTPVRDRPLMLLRESVALPHSALRIAWRRLLRRLGR